MWSHNSHIRIVVQTNVVCVLCNTLFVLAATNLTNFSVSLKQSVEQLATSLTVLSDTQRVALTHSRRKLRGYIIKTVLVSFEPRRS